MELNLKEDLAIDENSLDIEFLRHASLYRRYSDELTFCNDKLRRSEQRLKLIRSDLILEAKGGDTDLGLKPSDATVEAYYRRHPDYKRAEDEYHEAQTEVEMAQNSVWGLEKKKFALENLVKLLGMNYFSGPIEPRNLSKEFGKRVSRTSEEAEENVRERIKNRINSDRPSRRRAATTTEE